MTADGGTTAARRLVQAVYRQRIPADRIAEVVVPRSATARLTVVGLHLLPGVVALLLLHHARQPISRILRITEAAAQIGVIMTGIMITLGGAALLLPWLVDRLSLRDVIALLGLTRVDLTGLLLACVFAAAVLLAPTERLYEDELRSWLQGTWLGLPTWHFQAIDGFAQIPPLLAAVALVANIVGEELWFRGYLFRKLAFLGSWTWLIAGLLFIAYHIFEAPVAHPGLLGGLALTGLYALRRDLWSCVLLHTLLQAPI